MHAKGGKSQTEETENVQTQLRNSSTQMVNTLLHNADVLLMSWQQILVLGVIRLCVCIVWVIQIKVAAVWSRWKSLPNSWMTKHTLQRLIRAKQIYTEDPVTHCLCMCVSLFRLWRRMWWRREWADKIWMLYEKGQKRRQQTMKDTSEIQLQKTRFFLLFYLRESSSYFGTFLHKKT